MPKIERFDFGQRSLRFAGGKARYGSRNTVAIDRAQLEHTSSSHAPSSVTTPRAITSPPQPARGQRDPSTAPARGFGGITPSTARLA